MLKKLRWRFIGAAMGAFSTVILILLLAVNLWNYHITTRQQDSTLSLLQEFETKNIPPFEEGVPMPGPVRHFSPEMRYMTRFFTIRCDKDGHISDIGHDYIASVSREEAETYKEKVLHTKKTSGYYRNYRYLKTETAAETTLIFLNSEREIQSMKTLLTVSGAMALFSILAVFILVFLFSKRATAPYIRNIENQKHFITDAGHELKTPLTSISVSADVLAVEYENNEWIQNIRAQSAKLSKLISNLITLSRLNEEQPFPEQTDFSLSDAVWEIAEPLRPLTEAKGRIYEQEIEDNILFHGDKSAIQQMISILLDNAVKYSDEGGTVRLTVKKKQKKILISVRNTCTLSDTDDLNRLFDRFYRPDSSRTKTTGGTGIGLSIAKATVEAHGGKITVDSPEGKDITFTIILNSAL